MSQGSAGHEYTAEDAINFLHRHCTGVLEHDEVYTSIRAVFGQDGTPVTIGPPAWQSATSTVLFVPADVPDVLELLVSLEVEPGESADADRWRIYHGRPEAPMFYRLLLDAGKWRGQVFEGDELTQPNPLASIEPALCKWINSEHRDDLKAMSLAFNGVEIDEAIMVGVDPMGFDIRAKAGIIRVDALERLVSEEQARTVLEQMRREALGEKS